MIYSLENYSTINEAELELALSELNIDFIQENIIEQIRFLDTDTDFISPIEDRYSIIKEEFADHEDILNDASKIMVDIYDFLIDEIASSFDIDIDKDRIDKERYGEVAYGLYFFFVLKARKNIYKFYYKYMLHNKSLLVEPYMMDKTKDVLSVLLKKYTKNREDIVLLSKCPSLFKALVFNMEFTNKDFMSYIDNSEYYSSVVSELIENDIIMGNFVDRYVIMVRENVDLYDDIYARIFPKLTKKLLK